MVGSSVQSTKSLSCSSIEHLHCRFDLSRTSVWLLETKITACRISLTTDTDGARRTSMTIMGSVKFPYCTIFSVFLAEIYTTEAPNGTSDAGVDIRGPYTGRGASVKTTPLKSSRFQGRRLPQRSQEICICCVK